MCIRFRQVPPPLGLSWFLQFAGSSRAGQCYALQNFRGPKDEGSMAEAGVPVGRREQLDLNLDSCCDELVFFYYYLPSDASGWDP